MTDLVFSENTTIPSLPWVALGLTSLESIQVSLQQRLKRRGINWIQGRVDHLNPQEQKISFGEQSIAYDYLIIATGAELALDAIAGLGPDGYTQSVCNPHHTLIAHKAWQNFLLTPGPLPGFLTTSLKACACRWEQGSRGAGESSCTSSFPSAPLPLLRLKLVRNVGLVVGALPKTSCLGPAYEFTLLADYALRKQGLREQVSITFVTPEPYAGHLGIGGMANSAELVKKFMAERGVEVIENAAVTAIEPNQIHVGNGRVLPFA